VTHPALVTVGVVVALAVVAELLAVPVATRLLGDAIGRCVPVGTVRVEEVARPAVPRLVLGRARGVVLHLEDIEVQGLAVREARVVVERAVLPWAPGDPDPSPARIELVVEERALADRLGELTPLGVRPSLTLDAGAARLGLPLVPLDVVVAVDVRDDGQVALRPVGVPPRWWEQLDLPVTLPVPDDVRVEQVDIGDGTLTAAVTLAELPGADGEGCPDGPREETAP
jgi:hypothetical protein